MDLGDNPQVAVGGGVIGLMALATWGRKFLKDLRGDGTEANANAVQSDLIKHLRTEIDHLVGEVGKLNSRMDAMAMERDDSRTAAATAQAEAIVLKGKVAALEKDVADLKVELAEVEKERDKAHDRLVKVNDMYGGVLDGELPKRRAADRPDDRDRTVVEP